MFAANRIDDDGSKRDRHPLELLPMHVPSNERAQAGCRHEMIAWPDEADQTAEST
ncbi:MAG: hypothetical protein ACRDPA_19050 [Solirubrobacteraceae bacterium]